MVTYKEERNMNSSRKITILLLVLTGFLLTACSSPMAFTQEDTIPSQPVSQEQPGESLQQIVSMEVLVEESQQKEVYLVEKWGSKSRKTYKVTGRMGELLREHIGSVIKAEVLFLTRESWSGSVVVVDFREVLN